MSEKVTSEQHQKRRTKPPNSRNNNYSRRNNNNNAGNRNTSLSRSLSWALRHSAPSLGLKLSSDGFVPVKDVLNCGHKRFESCTEDDVRNVVASDNKQRYALCERPYREFHEGKEGAEGDERVLCIRANQGHTIQNVDAEALCTRISPQTLSQMEVIVHGTYKKAWDDFICHKGLSRMKRNHIHLASGFPKEQGVISGMRSNCEVYVYLSGERCARDGIEFFLSDNGVILTAGVNNEGTLPVRYFSHVVDAKSNQIILDQREKCEP